MTVIAWDGTTLAADKRAGLDMPRKVTKIRRTAKGELIGSTGSACTDQELMAWYEAGAVVADFPPTQRVTATSSYLIVIGLDRRIRWYGENPWPAVFEDPFHAIGSGRDFAMAAMHLGHTAVEAVAVACALTATCGDGIDFLTLEP